MTNACFSSALRPTLGGFFERNTDLEMNWYYAIDNQRVGPVSESSISMLLSAGTVSGTTLVWREGMANWQPLAETELARETAGVAPPTGPAPGSKLAPASSGETPFEFTGSAGEYFRIWIVNVALTVLTLGIYAAWAKVRKKRYFFGNTLLAGKPFEYTGDPIAILKGNLIIGGALLAYFISSAVFPPAGLIFMLILAITFPWLIFKALRFNAYNTRHRNIRFRFLGRCGESYEVNLWLPIVTPLTLGLLWPYVQYRKKKYVLGNLSFGSAHFIFDGQIGQFYGYFFKALGLLFLIVLTFGLIAAGLGSALQGDLDSMKEVFAIGGISIYVVALILLPIYYFTKVTVGALNATAIEGLARLHCTMRVREVLWLEFTNILAIVLSLGLAIPWAAIRRARYRTTHLAVTFTGDLDRVAASLEADQAALGDSAADAFDFDIAL